VLPGVLFGPIACAAVGGVVPVPAGAVGVALVAVGAGPVCIAPFGPTEVGAVGVACGAGTLLPVLGLAPFMTASSGDVANKVTESKAILEVFIYKSFSKSVTTILPFPHAIKLYRHNLYLCKRWAGKIYLLNRPLWKNFSNQSPGT
jgi:hypothetical protein